MPLFPLNNLRFIVLAVYPVLYFSYVLINKRKYLVQIIPIDISWFVFISLCFTSYFWSINGSLVWYQSFGWLSLLFWMLLFRDTVFDKLSSCFIHKLFCCFFCIGILQHFLAIFLGIEKNEEWNYFFSENINYTSSYMVSLLPFVLYYSSEKYLKILTIFKISSLFGLGVIIYFTSSRGAMIAFLFVFIFYLKDFFLKRFFKIYIGIILLFFISLFIGMFFSSSKLFNTIFYEFGLDGISGRHYMLFSSFKLFLEKPLTGIGLDNWHLDVFKYGLNGVQGIDNRTIIFKPTRSHNLYGQILAELGIVGFISFLFPIINILLISTRNSINLTNLQRAAFFSLCVYLILSLFYCDVNFYEYHFSGICLLAFCSLGILTSNNFSYYKFHSNWKLFLLIISALFSSIWFLYAKITHFKYLKAESLFQTNPAKAIQLLEEIYHPIFKTTHDYHNLYAAKLAILYEDIGDFDKAQHYFSISLTQAPHDINVLMSYTQFLMRVKRKPIDAKKHVLNVHSVQPKLYDAILYLAEIAIYEKKFAEAREYLNKVYDNRYLDRVWILELQLYYSDYLGQLIQLSERQKILLPEIRNKREERFQKQLELFEKEEKFQDLNSIKTKLNIDRTKQEVAYFHLLTNEQFLLYQKDRSKGKFIYQLKVLDNLLVLTENQKESILSLINDIVIKKDFLRLKSQLGNEDGTIFGKKEKEDIQQLNLVLDNQLTEILTAKQYLLFKEKQMGQRLNWLK